MPTIPCPRGSATRVVIESEVPFLLSVGVSRAFVTATAAEGLSVTPQGNDTVLVQIEELAPAGQGRRAVVAVPDDITVEVPAGLAEFDSDTRHEIGQNITERR
jgi:hypothetical protein